MDRLVSLALSAATPFWSCQPAAQPVQTPAALDKGSTALLSAMQVDARQLTEDECHSPVAAAQIMTRQPASVQEECAPDGSAEASTAELQQPQFNSLPPDVADRIFTLLQPSDLKYARLVSRAWLRQASAAAPVARPQVSRIKKLRSMFPRLTTLDLSKARGVTADHMPLIAALHPQLTKLSLKRCRGVANAALADLAPLTRLADLSIARCYQVTDAGLETLAAAFAGQLTALNLKYLYRVTDAGAASVARMGSLRSLDVTKCRKLTDGGAAALAGLTRLQCLKLSECDLVGDAGLAALAALSRLTRLQARLDHTLSAGRTDAGWGALLPQLHTVARLQISLEAGVADATLRRIARLATLEDLSLDRAYAVSDAGVGALSSLGRLSALELHEARELSDGGAAALAALSSLQVLVLHDAPGLSEAGVAALGGGLPRLRSLTLRQCDQVTGAGAAAFPGIAELELSLNPSVCDASLPGLAACTALTRVTLTGCQVSDAALPALAAALPRLASLSLSGCQGLRCETLGALGALSGLTDLDLSQCRGVGEATLHHLAGLAQLRVLNASVCPCLTDAGLEVLAENCPKRLRHVTVAGAGQGLVTRQGVAELLAALPANDDGLFTVERAVEFNHQTPNLLSLLTKRDVGFC